MAQYIDKDKIRNIIELFIAWNGETEPIDVANIDSAVEFIGSSLQEEPISEDLEEEIDNYVKRNGYDGLDSIEEVKYIANQFVKWQKTKDESYTSDLGEYINELSKQFPEVSFAKLSRIAVRVAKWQKEQIKKAMDLGELPYLISVEQAYYRTSKLLEE